MRGYAALGVEGVSKARNAGAVVRTAHAFDASFAFLVGGAMNRREIAQTDTSRSVEQFPLYLYDRIEDFALPAGCQLGLSRCCWFLVTAWWPDTGWRRASPSLMSWAAPSPVRAVM